MKWWIKGLLGIAFAVTAAQASAQAEQYIPILSYRVGPYAAELENGTLAGSTLTMDRAFANIVSAFGGSLVDAALMCATNPARELGLTGYGAIVPGGAADLVVLDRQLRVVRTFVGGLEVFVRT